MHSKSTLGRRRARHAGDSPRRHVLGRMGERVALVRRVGESGRRLDRRAVVRRAVHLHAAGDLQRSDTRLPRGVVHGVEVSESIRPRGVGEGRRDVATSRVVS